MIVHLKVLRTIPLILFACVLSIFPQKDTKASGEVIRNFLSTPLPAGLSKVEKDKRFLRMTESLNDVEDAQLVRQFHQAWIDATNSPDAMIRLAIHLLLNTGDINEGFALLESAQKAYASERKFLGEISAAARAAEYYADFMALEKAEKKLKEASLIAERNFGSYWNQAPQSYMKYRSLALIDRAYGRFYAKQGKDQEANQYYLKAIANYEKASEITPPPMFQQLKKIDPLEMALVWIRLGLSQTWLANTFEAERSLRKASSIYQSQGFPEHKQSFLKQVYADILTHRGLFNESIRQLKDNLAVESQMGVSDNSQRSLWLRVRIQRNLVGLEKWQELKGSLDESDRIAQNNPALERVAMNLPARLISLHFNGQSDQAIQKAKTWFDGATLRYGDASFLTHFRKALYAMTLMESSKQEDRQDALKLFKEAFLSLAEPKMAAQWNDYPLAKVMRKHLYASYIQALMNEQSKKPSDEIVQEIFKVAALGGNSAVEEAMNEAAARTKISDPELAKTVRLNQDARRELQVLYDLLQGGGEGPQLSDEARELLKKKIAELEASSEATMKTLTGKYPDFAALLAPKSVDIPGLQKQLSDKEAFLFLLPLKERLFSLAIHAGGFSYKEVALTQDKVITLVSKLRDTLDVAGYGSRAPRFNAEASHTLYKELIAPHLASLRNKQQLIVSASGPLAQIPFSVLLEAPWVDKDYVGAPWLGKKLAISYAPSPASWVASKSFNTKANNASTLLAWGDPAYKFGGTKEASGVKSSESGELVRSTALKRNAPVRDLTQPIVDVVVYDTLPPLPETRDEVKKLAEVLGGNPESDLILGDQATRVSVLKASETGELAKRSVVVFATHGLISGDLPNLTQPALAMAGTAGAEESPLLTLDDVLSLKMNADWVVLSACNTAAADGKAQEALSGLARGFFYAGSRSLLVTHWSVESDSAMLLTTETFKAYKDNPTLTRSEALQKARLSVMADKKYSHPAFWAPYVLVGEGGR